MTSSFSFRLALLALVLVAGCGGDGTAYLTGKVTYEGRAVEQGYITFLAADGVGPPAGAEIRDGRYTIKSLTAGPKVVKVEAVKAIPFARSSEEMARRAAANTGQREDSGIAEAADVIPADAEGNNAEVEVWPGRHALDFHLTRPAGR
jgi:hypothetical protein